jgi:hypothetical protein
MGDMGTHCERANDDFKDRAYAKYGHLSKEDIVAEGDRIRAELEKKRAALRALSSEVYAMQAEEDLLTAVYVDYLNNRHRNANAKKAPA